MEDNNKPIRYIKSNDFKRELTLLAGNLANMSATQIDGDAEQVISTLAEYIMELNPMATLNDIRIAFKNAAKGHYGQFFKLSMVQMYHFVKEYFANQTNRVNCQYIEEEPQAPRNRLMDRKNFMAHMYAYHISGERIYGGWHYCYETMIANGWATDNDLTANLQKAYKALAEELETRKFAHPEQRHEIDRMLAEIADCNNSKLISKAQEMTCREKFDEWHSIEITPDNVFAQTLKIN